MNPCTKNSPALSWRDGGDGWVTEDGNGDW